VCVWMGGASMLSKLPLCSFVSGWRHPSTIFSRYLTQWQLRVSLAASHFQEPFPSFSNFRPRSENDLVVMSYRLLLYPWQSPMPTL
jgi:hypothetical protein